MGAAEGPPWNMADGLFNNHLRLIEKHQFWKDAFKAPAPVPNVWHLHPFGFIEQLRSMKGVTVDQILRIKNNTKRKWVEPYIGFLNETMERYEIDTPLLQAHFLAQLGVESAPSLVGRGGPHLRPPFARERRRAVRVAPQDGQRAARRREAIRVHFPIPGRKPEVDRSLAEGWGG